jgi:hypothetical protein
MPIGGIDNISRNRKKLLLQEAADDPGRKEISNIVQSIFQAKQ